MDKYQDIKPTQSLNLCQTRIQELSLAQQAWLRLALIPRLRRKALMQILTKAGPIHLCQQSSSQLASLGLTQTQIQFLKNTNLSKVAQIQEWLAQSPSRSLLLYGDVEYPFLLRQISSAPLFLFIEGNKDILTMPQVAIVGSRHASYQSLNAASQFAQYFVEQGVSVTSGLALGVDGHAHQGALDAQQTKPETLAKTIAVLGTGLDNIYPKKHTQLARDIIEHGGAVISEFLPHTPPKPQNFPRRNRIISGLSLAVLVVEAAQRSGSLITARYALEQNRDVFSLPSSIAYNGGNGSNKLLQDGAIMALSPQDVFEHLQQDLSNFYQLFSEHQTELDFSQEALQDNKSSDTSLPIKPKISELSLASQKILDTLTTEPIAIDIIATRTHIPVHEIMSEILDLELTGLVSAVAGGYIRI